MLTSISVKFIFDSAWLGLFSSANSRCGPWSCVPAMFLAIIPLACVASISSQGSSRKLGQEQKK